MRSLPLCMCDGETEGNLEDRGSIPTSDGTVTLRRSAVSSLSSFLDRVSGGSVVVTGLSRK